MIRCLVKVKIKLYGTEWEARDDKWRVDEALYSLIEPYYLADPKIQSRVREMVEKDIYRCGWYKVLGYKIVSVTQDPYIEEVDEDESNQEEEKNSKQVNNDTTSKKTEKKSWLGSIFKKSDNDKWW